MEMNYKVYTNNGEDYDRITTILGYFKSPDLIDWLLRVGKSEANKSKKLATGIGTNVDEAIKADILMEKSVKLKTQEANSCWEAWLQWKKDFSPAEMKIGFPLFDHLYHVAGTPDILIPETREVIDIKCSSSIRDEYWLQTEFYGRKLGYLSKSILRLDKNLGIYEYKKMPLNDEHWEAVEGAIKLFRYYNKPVTDSKRKGEENAITYTEE